MTMKVIIVINIVVMIIIIEIRRGGSAECMSVSFLLHKIVYITRLSIRSTCFFSSSFCELHFDHLATKFSEKIEGISMAKSAHDRQYSSGSRKRVRRRRRRRMRRRSTVKHNDAHMKLTSYTVAYPACLMQR